LGIVPAGIRGCSIFPHSSRREERMSIDRKGYWRENIQLVFGCIFVWFVVSYGFGILLVDFMNKIPLGGYKLGFWFAQQGSLYIFVVLIFFYAARMNKLDRKYNVQED
jgi:putative solute:sodium symporter small subunit